MKKYNEIKLTKNKMDLNNRKMKKSSPVNYNYNAWLNHPPPP